MKKFTLLAASLSLLIILITACKSDETKEKESLPNNPKEVGNAFASLECIQKSLMDEAQEIGEKMYDLDMEVKKDRAEMAKIKLEIYDLEKQYMANQKKMSELASIQWDFFEDKDKYEEWMNDFQEAYDKGIAKCQDKDGSGSTN